MFTLETFGGLALRRDDAPVTGRTVQRRRLALLALLAAERRPLSRDKLAAFFWPDADAERARHLLADTLYVLRAGLGDAALATPGDDVALNEEIVNSDVAAFLGAVADKEWRKALALSRGPFLDGVFVSDAPEFERWVESTRSRLDDERHRCIERLGSDATARGDHADATTWWRMLAAEDPLSSRAAIGLLRAFSAAGDRAAALQFARVHEQLIRSELGADPDPAVTTLVAQLRSAAVPTPLPVKPGEVTAPDPVQPAAPADNSPRSQESVGPPPTTRRPRTVWLATLVVAVIAAVLVSGSTVVARYRRPAQTGSLAKAAQSGQADSGRPAIIVLPFQSIGADRDADYVADGITEDLMWELDATLRKGIVSKTTAAAAKRSGASIQALGGLLHVQYAVEGSVQLAGSQMRIGARLVRVSDDRVLWSDKYALEFSPKSIPQIEAEIARSIATALNVKLARTGPRPERQSPRSIEALEYYNRGRFFLDSRSPEGVAKAIEDFQRAIRLDTGFAAAHAGLADGYASFAIGNIGDYRADDYFPLSRNEAVKALALDSTLAEAHAALGYFNVLYQLDWDAAERELTRALDLRASYSSAHSYRAILFEWTGHYDRALSEAQIAKALDPLSLFTNIELARAFFFNARYDSAEAQLRATIDLDSTSLRAHMLLGQVLEHQRRFDEAIHELAIAARLSARTSRPLALLAHGYASAGRKAEATAMLDSLQARSTSRYVPALDFAIVHVGLGHTDEALGWLERAVADHSIRPYLMDPTFDSLRTHPRFVALLERLNLRTNLPAR